MFICLGIFVELLTRSSFVPDEFYFLFFAGPFNSGCHAHTADPAFSCLSNVSYCQIKYSFVCWLPEALLETLTVGTVCKTHHFSLRSGAEFLSCDEGHLVPLSLGYTFSAANPCCDHRLFGRTSAITSILLTIYFHTGLFVCCTREKYKSNGCIWQ